MSKTKSDKLKMNYSTACNKLKKHILYSLAEKLNMLTCFRCNEKIDNIDNFSIDHKISWKDDVSLFWDLDNISFSHSKCNFKHGADLTNEKRKWTHGNYGYIIKKCRCEICKKGHDKYR